MQYDVSQWLNDTIDAHLNIPTVRFCRGFGLIQCK